MAHNFNAKGAARGNHVYKNTIWEEAKYRDKYSMDPETDKKRARSFLLCYQNMVG